MKLFLLSIVMFQSPDLKFDELRGRLQELDHPTLMARFDERFALFWGLIHFSLFMVTYLEVRELRLSIF
jgi:hypothetical protein